MKHQGSRESGSDKESAMHGLRPDDIVERESGGYVHRAIVLTELGGALETVAAEFEYDADEHADGLVRLCHALNEHLSRLSLAKDAMLTLNRECSRCSGKGRTRGENPCVECAGRGYAHADEADG